jgi:hypothetical protein
MTPILEKPESADQLTSHGGGEGGENWKNATLWTNWRQHSTFNDQEMDTILQ